MLAGIAEVRAQVAAWRGEGESVGLVPTMGALHEGHLSLVDASRRAGGRTLVSIFVNPLQFGPNEDLAAYPRDPEKDLAMLGERGADAVFMPSVEEMYPPGREITVQPGPLADPLEGAHRPGHFAGVATVVTKLLNIVQPDRAYFGRKDAQQLAVVERLVADLNIPVEIVGCPIVRAEDGLALSSRNAYLDPTERLAATCLHRALAAGNEAYGAGIRDAGALRRALLSVLAREPLAAVHYAEVVDPATFRPPGRLAVLAVKIGRARLIDNHLLGEPL